MSKETKFVIIFFSIAISLFIVWNRCGVEKFKNASFQGIVSKIRYGDKNTPIAEINNIEYVLPSVKGDVIIGDSLVKRKNSLIVEQYRDGEWIREHEW